MHYLLMQAGDPQFYLGLTDLVSSVSPPSTQYYTLPSPVQVLPLPSHSVPLPPVADTVLQASHLLHKLSHGATLPLHRRAGARQHQNWGGVSGGGRGEVISNG